MILVKIVVLVMVYLTPFTVCRYAAFFFFFCFRPRTCRPYGGRHRRLRHLRYVYSSTRSASVRASFRVGSHRPKTRCLTRAPAGHDVSRWVASSGTPSSQSRQSGSYSSLIRCRYALSMVEEWPVLRRAMIFPAEVYLVPQFDAGRADDLVVFRVAVARSPLAAQILPEASSRRVVVCRHSVLRQRGRQSGRLVRRLVARDACVAWHPLYVHPVSLSDGPEAGPDFIRELFGLLGGPLRQTPQRGLGVRADSDASDPIRRGGGDAFQVFACLLRACSSAK